MLNQQLVIGSTYRLRFKGIFERHGVCSTPSFTCLHKGDGVFRLTQISSFNDLAARGVKIYDNFFAPLGIDQKEYNSYFSGKPADQYTTEYTTKMVTTEQNEQRTLVTTDPVTGEKSFQVRTVRVVKGHEAFVQTGKSKISRHLEENINYADYPIYKFVDVIDANDAIYVPELTLDGFPEIDISEYKDLHLVFSLGLFNKTEQLDPLLLSIRERLAVYGIKPKNIKMYSTGTKWLNPDEYEQMRSIRLPAEVKTIPVDANFEDYRGKEVLINGGLKEIVETVEEGKEEAQVKFEALKSKNDVIDDRYFLQMVAPGEVYVSGKTYYETLTNGALRIMTPDLTAPGDEIMKMKYIQRGQPGTAKRFYKKVYGDYVLVPHGEYRDVSHACNAYNVDTPLFDVDPLLPDEWYYYKKTIEIIDGGAVQEKYEKAVVTDITTESLPLYRKLVDRYVDLGTNYDVAKDQPVGENDDYETIGETKVLKIYTSTPLFNADATAADAVKGTGEFFYENYAHSTILSHISDLFSYRTADNQPKSCTLEIPDMIEFSLQKQYADVTLPLMQNVAELVDPTVTKTKSQLYALAQTENPPQYVKVSDDAEHPYYQLIVRVTNYATYSGEWAGKEIYELKKDEFPARFAKTTDTSPVAGKTYYVYDTTKELTLKSYGPLEGTQTVTTEVAHSLWVKKYAGRRFRYSFIYGKDADERDLSTSVEVTLPAAPDYKFSELSGDIMGQNGTISKEVYFLEDTTLKRNYYMQYTMLRHEYDKLLHKCNELEKHLVKIAVKETA